MTMLSQEIERAVKRHNIAPVVGTQIDTLWELIWPLFREVPGFLDLYDEAWTYQNIKMGDLQVWAYSDSEIRGMVLTRINVFPKCKVLDVMTISGIAGVDFMQELDDVFEMLARQQECKFISVAARPGMERLLARRHRGQRRYSVLSRPVGLLRSS